MTVAVKTSQIQRQFNGMTFKRGSTAYRSNGLIAGLNNPRLEVGKNGMGVFIEEGTTNLVYNSDFEIVTGTRTVFFDALTSYTGSTVPAPWTLEGGSFTFDASGATCGSFLSVMKAGNNAWKPLAGQTLTVQATFTTPATLGSNEHLLVDLYQDGSNRYRAEFYGNGANVFRIWRFSGGTNGQIGSSAAQTMSPSTSYTITLSIDQSGNLTARLYSGVGTGGTLLQTVTATDTSVTGGFLIAVGGDTGVVISNTQVKGPFPDSWNLNVNQGASGLCYETALVQGYFGNYAMALKMTNTGSGGWGVFQSNTLGVTDGNTYTWSFYAKADTACTVEARIAAASGLNSFAQATINLTTQWQKFTFTGTAPTGSTGSGQLLYINIGGISPAGTRIYVDAAQVEQKSYVTSYHRNDSTTVSATRGAESLTIPISVINPTTGTVRFIFTPYYNAGDSVSTGSSRILIMDSSGVFKIWRWGGISSSTYLATFEFHDSAANRNYKDIFTASQSITKNTPVEIVFSWNNGTLKAYCNGVLLQTWTMTVTTPGTLGNVLCVGADASQQSNAYGVFDDLAIWNRALSDTEVSNMYTGTIPSDYVFYESFDVPEVVYANKVVHF
jgi:hypothetical protein